MNRGENLLKKKEELNIMANIKIIEELKASLLCIIGEFFSLLTRGTNAAKDSILNCIAGAILILYVLAQKLGYSCNYSYRISVERYLYINQNTGWRLLYLLVEVRIPRFYLMF